MSLVEIVRRGFGFGVPTLYSLRALRNGGGFALLQCLTYSEHDHTIRFMYGECGNGEGLGRLWGLGIFCAQAPDCLHHALLSSDFGGCFSCYVENRMSDYYLQIMCIQETHQTLERVKLKMKKILCVYTMSNMQITEVVLSLNGGAFI